MTTLQTKGVAIREVDGLSTEVFDSSSQKALARPEFAMARKFTIRIVFFAVLASLLGFCLPQKHSATTNTVTFPDLYEASIAELQSGLASGLFTSVDLVKAYLARIEEVNLQGPTLRAVIETNPSALSQAEALDRERTLTGPRGPLHGIPIIVKDNIATLHSEGMNTTAGSFALLGSVVPRDATVAGQTSCSRCDSFSAKPT
ncbi:hypothetical protein QCA50_014162 [Cerrena zonata]|uniref:Amidase domain-containing protein n=1 Tax=Cerrena zonata TaxID=2478898 RepID=A0AAW0FX58_9APHY